MGQVKGKHQYKIWGNNNINLFLGHETSSRTKFYATCTNVVRISQYSADQLVYLDESVCNEHTADGRYARAPIGAKAICSTPAIRSERYLILPAYTIDGYLAWQAYQGSYNANQFMEFV